MGKKLLVILAVLAALISGLLIASKVGMPRPAKQTETVLRVVAAENFWGSIASQIGGARVSVLSVVSDPNADPHEYESNTDTAIALANADYVIVNGAGYDGWAKKLLAANPSRSRKVLDVASLLGKKSGDNPHFWYSPEYVNETAAQIEKDLTALDPAGQSYYAARYQEFENSAAVYQNKIASIKQQFAGTKVASTEDIFSYLANAAGLDLISPPAFMQAVAEGNDPPTQSVAEFQNQLKSKEPAVLVYNQQTITPLTSDMKKMALQEGIPIIGVTEIVQPSNMPFQDWMNAEVTELQNALSAKAGGK
ncbi:MAG: zinc ABC transporter substrate-binding protein [Patescibacteria group bacterium]|nr:zinc ABC transporter substrate-binding protein [Patescibacteria group bacterium]